MQHIIIQRIFRTIFVIGIVFLALYLFFFLSKYTYPFLFALGFAFLMNPLVNYLSDKAKIPRPFAVFFVILFILLIIIGFITLLILEIINGMTSLAKEVPQYFTELVEYIELFIVQNIIPLYENFSSMVNSLDPSARTQILDAIENIGTGIAEAGQDLLSNILTWIPEQIAGIPNFATVLIFSLLGTFFISKDWYKIQERVQHIIPQKVVHSSSNVFDGLKGALVGFIKAQLTLISITSIIVLIGLLILQVDYAITLALLIGAVDLMPYLGTGLVFIPWIFYMFFTGNYFLTIGLAILYIVVIIQRQLMEPKILSTNIGLDPLATLIALFAGYKMFGFLGLIIGPVVLVFINTLIKTGVLHEIWSFIKGEVKK
ncbi:sporulation integral membrane protein YtvI [Salirhabdus sp. Marseille-P4669]|uniref:sporulation integral membrane protein YtvI n=1 Tax=Salirhabdus sp. Marseille-P4669 TaxID=2042310 RepID=UPI001F1F1175|nr:sporulation integral membrane protein YtvI [Salirhabdus sp. Marseille-P4669]